jgi:predicted ATP-grasp superfamily ATP-dependent carboligase
MTPAQGPPPVIVLGGGANALSIGRSIGALGVKVYSIGAAPYLRYSRFLQPITPPSGDDLESSWAACLLGPETDHLRGAVVLATSDEGIAVVARNRGRLAERFLLDVSDVAAQLDMLDKLATYEAAVAAGVPTPRFWRLNGLADLEQIRGELVFPLIVKPLHSHAYTAVFPGRSKFRIATNLDELVDVYREMRAADIAVMLVEKIVGPDDLLCSYYTYIDASGTPTLDFTKRIVRRHPPNMGVASYHITDWNPEVRDVALRLFKHVGLRGVANAEFKRDRRDGELKLIECNARFTDATCLLVKSGLDLSQHVYFHIIGEPRPAPTTYATGRRLLYLSNDLLAFRALREKGEISWPQYIRSLMHPQSFGYWSANDPGPAVARGVGRVVKLVAQAIGTTCR